MPKASREWIKASHSAGIGACVEVCRDGSEIILRNSRAPQMEQSFTQAEFAAFVEGARLGEFDHLIDQVP